MARLFIILRHVAPITARCRRTPRFRDRGPACAGDDGTGRRRHWPACWARCSRWS